MFMAFLKLFTYPVLKDFAIAQLFFDDFQSLKKLIKLELPDKYSVP